MPQVGSVPGAPALEGDFPVCPSRSFGQYVLSGRTLVKEKRWGLETAPIKQAYAEVILKKAKRKFKRIPTADRFQNFPGKGVKTRYRVKEILLGNRQLMSASGVDFSPLEGQIQKFEDEGKTAMILAVNKKVLGIVAVADVLRENSAEVVWKLREVGLEVIMLTGDNPRTARAIAREAGIDKVLAEVLPGEKAEEMVGIAADGIGYGQDGTIWGGEVMVASPNGFKRVGGLAKQLMPGGDLATHFPARMVAGILWQKMSAEEIEQTLKEFCHNGFRHGDREVEAVINQLERNLNVFQTSSCGRILDAVACLLGVCNERTYEGEPAIKLEATANAGDPEKIDLNTSFKEVEGLQVLDTSFLLSKVLEARKVRTPRKDIAAGAQHMIGQGLAKLAINAAQDEGINTIGVSGGVFYNDAITGAVKNAVLDEGLKYVRHERTPPGDGGISVGQALVAANRLRETN